MRAVRYARYGDSSVLALADDVPLPQRRRGEALVSVRAVGVNQLDGKLREGMGGRLAGARLPAIPGCELAGVVAAAGEGSVFKPGQRVFAMLPVRLEPGPGGAAGGLSCLSHPAVPGCHPTGLSQPTAPQAQVGACAEFAAVPESALAAVPDGVSDAEAAATPVAALAAWQCLDAASLQAGQTVLIHAGAGGVGTMAIQVRRAALLPVCQLRAAPCVPACSAAAPAALPRRHASRWQRRAA